MKNLNSKNADFENVSTDNLSFNSVNSDTPQSVNDVLAWNGSSWEVKAAADLGVGGGGGGDAPSSFVSNIPAGVESYAVTYGPFSSTPRIASSLEINGDGEIIPYTMSGVSETGYHVVFSEATANTNYNIHTVFGGESAGESGGGAGSSELVVTVSGGKFFIDGTQQLELSLQRGFSYRFDQSDSTNSSHPIKFSTTSDGTHNTPGGSEYTAGIVYSGTPGSAGAYAQVTLSQSSPNLYYYCGNHSGMGGSALGGITLQANGNVGIGTTSPNASLEISGPWGSQFRISRDIQQGQYSEISGGGSSMKFKSVESSTHSSFLFVSDNGTDEVERMRIDASGNVGIGTTNPLSVLAVQDSTHGGSIQIGSSSGEDKYQYVNFADNWQIGKNNLTASSIGQPGSLYIHNLDRATTDFCITSNGNVGIGTANPNQGNLMLYADDAVAQVFACGGADPDYRNWAINAGGTTKGALHFQVGDSVGDNPISSSKTKVTFDKEGNVGIGTTSPGAKLHVDGDAIVDELWLGGKHSTSAAENSKKWIKCAPYDWPGSTNPDTIAAISMGADATGHDDGNIDFYTALNENISTDASNLVHAMRINSAGNVGIGITAPIDKLSVVTEASVYAAGFSATDVTVQACWSNKLATPTTYGMVIQSVGGSSSNGYLIGCFGAGSEVFKVKNNGDVFSNTNSFTSDDRVKHNEETIIGAIETLGKLTPKKYIKTTKMYDADHNFELDADGNPVDEDGELVDHCIEAGVIAQQVLTVDELSFTVSPEGVDEDGTATSPHTLNYNSLFTYAIAAIQEQQKLIEDLKSRIETLES